MREGVYACTHTHTHPECESVEGAWLMTGPDWEEVRVCWAARLQLGPTMGPWDCGCCSGWVWGWCSGAWGCGCWGWGGCWSWSWPLSWFWFIQGGPLWVSVCGEKRMQQTAGTILNGEGTALLSICVCFCDPRRFWCVRAYVCFGVCLSSCFICSGECDRLVCLSLQQVRCLQSPNWVWLLLSQVSVKTQTWQTWPTPSDNEGQVCVCLTTAKDEKNAASYFFKKVPVCSFLLLLVLEETPPLSPWTDQPLHSSVEIWLASASGLEAPHTKRTDGLLKNMQTLMWCFQLILLPKSTIAQIMMPSGETSRFPSLALSLSLSVITSVCLSGPSKHAGVKGRLGSLFWHKISCRRCDRLQDKRHREKRRRGRVCRG